MPTRTPQRPPPAPTRRACTHKLPSLQRLSTSFYLCARVERGGYAQSIARQPAGLLASLLLSPRRPVACLPVSCELPACLCLFRACCLPDGVNVQHPLSRAASRHRARLAALPCTASTAMHQCINASKHPSIQALKHRRIDTTRARPPLHPPGRGRVICDRPAGVALPPRGADAAQIKPCKPRSRPR